MGSRCFYILENYGGTLKLRYLHQKDTWLRNDTWISFEKNLPELYWEILPLTEYNFYSDTSRSGRNARSQTELLRISSMAILRYRPGIPILISMDTLSGRWPLPRRGSSNIYRASKHLSGGGGSSLYVFFGPQSKSHPGIEILTIQSTPRTSVALLGLQEKSHPFEEKTGGNYDDVLWMMGHTMKVTGRRLKVVKWVRRLGGWLIRSRTSM